MRSIRPVKTEVRLHGGLTGVGGRRGRGHHCWAGNWGLTAGLDTPMQATGASPGLHVPSGTLAGHVRLAPSGGHRGARMTSCGTLQKSPRPAASVTGRDRSTHGVIPSLQCPKTGHTQRTVRLESPMQMAAPQKSQDRVPQARGRQSVEAQPLQGAQESRDVKTVPSR